jgi:hypothetical protein
MTGRLLLRKQDQLIEKHTHFRMILVNQGQAESSADFGWILSILAGSALSGSWRRLRKPAARIG